MLSIKLSINIYQKYFEQVKGLQSAGTLVRRETEVNFLNVRLSLNTYFGSNVLDARLLIFIYIRIFNICFAAVNSCQKNQLSYDPCIYLFLCKK